MYFLSDIGTKDLDTPICWANRRKDYWGICSNRKPISSNLSSVNALLFTWGILFCTEPVSLIIFTSLYIVVLSGTRRIGKLTTKLSPRRSFHENITDKNALFFAVTHKWTHTLDSLAVNTILKSEGSGISSEGSGTIKPQTRYGLAADWFPWSMVAFRFVHLVYIYIYIYIKVKVSPLQAMNAHGGCGCKGPHIHSHGTRMR